LKWEQGWKELLGLTAGLTQRPSQFDFVMRPLQLGMQSRWLCSSDEANVVSVGCCDELWKGIYILESEKMVF